jgi:hypothetical protein
MMVMTYDQLLAQGERLVEILSPSQESASGGGPEAMDVDDDIPF